MNDPPLNPPSQVFDSGASNYEASTGGCTHDLARSTLSLISPLPSGSIVHDNACGTGIVAQQIVASSILTKLPQSSDFSLTIHCTDKSSSMIALATSGFRNCQTATEMQIAFPSVDVHFSCMPSENLAFPDNYFTHSFTNCGILWFDDGDAGAREILRTLKPDGVAFVTSWKELGQFDVVREAQRVCGHAEPLFQPPVDGKWFRAEYLEGVLSEVGFEEVEVVERTVHFAGKDAGDLCGHLMGLLSMLRAEWAGEEERKFRKELEIAAGKAAVSIKRIGLDGSVESLIGIPMVALVGVARKER